MYEVIIGAENDHWAGASTSTPIVVFGYIVRQYQPSLHKCNQCKMQSPPQQMTKCQSYFQLSSAKEAVKSSQCVISLCFISSGSEFMQTTLLILRPGRFISNKEGEGM